MKIFWAHTTQKRIFLLKLQNLIFRSLYFFYTIGSIVVIEKANQQFNHVYIYKVRFNSVKEMRFKPLCREPCVRVVFYPNLIKIVRAVFLYTVNKLKPIFWAFLSQKGHGLSNFSKTALVLIYSGPVDMFAPNLVEIDQGVFSSVLYTDIQKQTEVL